MTRSPPNSASSQSSHSFGSPRRRVSSQSNRNSSLIRRSDMDRIDRTLLRNGPGAADDFILEMQRARGTSAAFAVAANPAFSPAAGAMPDSAVGNYAPADFDEFDLNLITDLSSNNSNSFNQVVQNVTAAGLAGLKATTDAFVQPLHVISRKRLRDIISQGNNSLLGFLRRSDKTPLIGSANSAAAQNFGDFLLRKYGIEIGNLKYLNSGKEHAFLKDINVDTGIKKAVNEIDEILSKHGPSHIDEFIQQIRWVSEELRQVSDNILRLENLILKKMEMIDAIATRTQFLSALKPNDGLGPLLDAFGTYVEKAYESNKIEDDFKELMESYKKWVILKDIVGLQKTVDQACSQNTGAGGGHDPVCSICLTESISHAVVPCGHTFCQACVKKQTLTCYICRGSIKDRVKIFFT